MPQLTFVLSVHRLQRVRKHVVGHGYPQELPVITRRAKVYAPKNTGVLYLLECLSEARKRPRRTQRHRHRLVPFDRSSAGRQVGPIPSQCTDAAWSPDGQWMYFTAMTASGVHIWRQRFPDGAPEQVTSGAVTEEGIHVAHDGRSFVTSIGTSQSTLWVHDSRGDRQITSEGYGFMPSISPDGTKL
jgi:hypothetical protein